MPRLFPGGRGGTALHPPKIRAPGAGRSRGAVVQSTEITITGQFCWASRAALSAAPGTSGTMTSARPSSPMAKTAGQRVGQRMS